MSGERAPDWPLLLWIGLAALAVIDMLWLALTPLSLDPRDLPKLVKITAGAVTSIAVAYRYRQHPTFFTLLSGSAITLSAWPLLRVLNHLTMSVPLSLADERLAAWDAAIGFDWLSYIRWVDAHPAALHLMNVTYQGLTAYSCVASAVIHSRCCTSS